MAQASSAARKQLKKSPTTAKMTVSLHVNGIERKLVIAPWTTLLDALRLYLDLSGTKRVATTANAAPVPCWSMAGGSTRASRWRS
jgi:hypothetical protein